MTVCPPGLMAVGERLADAARAVLRAHFRTPLEVITKADESPVTLADREAETAMREIIAAACPDHGVIGEEHGADRPEAEFVWVLDPIDGTKAFLSGVPVFGSLVALLQGGVPVLGIVDQPVTGERWVGAAGHPTTLNGGPVQALARGGLDRAVLWSTSPHMFDADPADAAAFARLRDSVAVLHYGGECYQYAMLASGHIDLVVEGDMSAYDFCAHVPIIQGAGGVITDWQGAALGLASDGRVLAAADSALHEAARRVLAGP